MADEETYAQIEKIVEDIVSLGVVIERLTDVITGTVSDDATSQEIINEAIDILEDKGDTQ